MSLHATDLRPLSTSVASMSRASRRRSSSRTPARCAQIRRNAANSFSPAKGSTLPSRLLTLSPGAPSFSYVVNRRLQAAQTRRRRMPSAVTRVSVTLESPLQ